MVKVISEFRRKGGNDSFSIKKTAKVCEFDFPINCIRISCGYGKKSLVKGSIPLVFKFKQEPPKKKKSPKKRNFELETVTESDSFTDASSDSDSHSDHSEKMITDVNSEMPHKLVIGVTYSTSKQRV